MVSVCCLLYGNGAGLAAHVAEYSHPSPYATLTSSFMLSGQSYHCPGGMAVTPWQSAPDAVTALLNGRLHRAVPGQVTVDSRTSMGSSMASATVKTSHKALPPPPDQTI